MSTQTLLSAFAWLGHSRRRLNNISPQPVTNPWASPGSAAGSLPAGMYSDDLQRGMSNSLWFFSQSPSGWLTNPISKSAPSSPQRSLVPAILFCQARPKPQRWALECKSTDKSMTFVLSSLFSTAAPTLQLQNNLSFLFPVSHHVFIIVACGLMKPTEGYHLQKAELQFGVFQPENLSHPNSAFVVLFTNMTKRIGDIGEPLADSNSHWERFWRAERTSSGRSNDPGYSVPQLIQDDKHMSAG